MGLPTLSQGPTDTEGRGLLLLLGGVGGCAPPQTLTLPGPCSPPPRVWDGKSAENPPGLQTAERGLDTSPGRGTRGRGGGGRVPVGSPRRRSPPPRMASNARHPGRHSSRQLFPFKEPGCSPNTPAPCSLRPDGGTVPVPIPSLSPFPSHSRPCPHPCPHSRPQAATQLPPQPAPHIPIQGVNPSAQPGSEQGVRIPPRFLPPTAPSKCWEAVGEAPEMHALGMGVWSPSGADLGCSRAPSAAPCAPAPSASPRL